MFVNNWKWDNNGFSLAEAIVALFIVSMLYTVLLPLFQHMHILKKPRNTFEIANVQTLILHMAREIEDASSIRVQQKGLELQFPTETHQYEQYGTLLRRQVMGKGHEVMLYHISDVSFQFLPKRDSIVFSFRSNEKQVYTFEFVAYGKVK